MADATIFIPSNDETILESAQRTPKTQILNILKAYALCFLDQAESPEPEQAQWGRYLCRRIGERQIFTAMTEALALPVDDELHVLALEVDDLRKAWIIAKYQEDLTIHTTDIAAAIADGDADLLVELLREYRIEIDWLGTDPT